MLIKYYLEGVEFSNRTRDLIPRKDEIIRLLGKLYIIDVVVWIEDEERPCVAIDLIRPK